MIDTALILAAGRGSRLKEVTATRSKAMAPVAGKPIIGRVIDALKEAGISRFIVIGAPHDGELRTYCASIPNALFLVQEKPLGSGDALKVAAAHTPTQFVVCACDSLIPAADIKNLIAHHADDAVATLSILEVPPEVSLGARSVVAVQDNRVVNFVEKPKESERISNLSSLPLYVLTNEIFPALSRITPSPRGEYELPEVFRAYIAQGKIVRAVRASDRFDLTDQADLLALNERFLKTLSPQIQIHQSVTIPPSTRIHPPVLIEEGVFLGEDSTIGPCVYLETNARIDTGCTISHAVVTRGARVTGNSTSKVVT
jgi:glucose-1-phosphate thymidylyltransferase